MEHFNVKHNYTTDFFNGELTREEQFWILGWWFSDGNVCRDRVHCLIDLHSRDEEVLHKIKSVLHAPQAIRHGKNRPSCCLGVSSAVFARRLIELGCVPAKSLIVKYPECVKTIDHHRWFLRGLFEGDGNLSFHSSNGKSVACSISSGSIDLLRTLKTILQDALGIDGTIAYRGDKCVCIYIGHGYSDAYRFMSFIYDDARPELTLARKYQTWLQLKSRVDYYRTNLKSHNYQFRFAKSFYIKSPDGKIYFSNVIRRFSIEFGLCKQAVSYLLNGRNHCRSVRKWTLPTDQEIASSEIIQKIYS